MALEAFKAGQIDFRIENISKQWATGYDFPAYKKGLVRKEEIRHHLPTGMQGFAFNIRRPAFKDVRVRQALAWAYDFEWANKNLFYGAYTRTKSFYSNSDLASSGLPEGDELALLEKYRDKLAPVIFTKPFELPVTDGSGNNREELRFALGLLKEAGYEVKDRKLIGPDGKQMSFELVLDSPSFERVALPYVETLKKLGIETRVRTVDEAQYQRLMDSFDFDMAVIVYGESTNPGNEQLGYWSCASGQQEGGDNAIGICDPVVDALVANLIAVDSQKAQLAAAHALDRVLLHGWVLWCRIGIRNPPVWRSGTALPVPPSKSVAVITCMIGGSISLVPRWWRPRGAAATDGSLSAAPLSTDHSNTDRHRRDQLRGGAILHPAAP